MSDQLTPEHIAHWRKQLDDLAFDTRTLKRFQLSPDGRFVVTVGGAVAYDGNDEAKAISLYNAN
jgi:hypothetical protein